MNGMTASNAITALNRLTPEYEYRIASKQKLDVMSPEELRKNAEAAAMAQITGTAHTLANVASHSTPPHINTKTE